MTIEQIRVGTRGSKLALAQTGYVTGLLQQAHPRVKIKLVTVTTTGDTDHSSPLSAIGGTGVFTKQIETELLKGTIDVAVHSAKDLPSIMTEGLCIGCVPTRERCEDVWISRDDRKLMETEAPCVVGTSSPRRQAQLLHLRPDLEVKSIRGNIETRLLKLSRGKYDAVIMAQAGLKRINLDDRITEILSPDVFLPAPGQGTLMVQIRSNDDTTARLLRPLDKLESRRCLEIERLVLRKLNAGCSTPLGALALFTDGEYHLKAEVLDSGSRKKLLASHKIVADQSDEMLVQEVVRQLLEQGAMSLIGN